MLPLLPNPLPPMSESADAPLVYVILGAAGAGRRGVVADVIEGGMEANDRLVVFLAEGESPEPEIDGKLPTAVRWQRGESGAIEATWPEGATVGFFITDGRANPVDQIEALKPWIKSQGVELARVVTVYHCALVEAHPKLMAWHDACVHFSDLVLLNRREGVANKWVSDLRTRFSKQYLPCLVEMVKKGRVTNPGLVLDQQVRRLSHWFDEEDNEWMGLVDGDTEIIIEDEEDSNAEEEMDLDQEDLYLARHPSGLRVKDIPDIRPMLDDFTP